MKGYKYKRNKFCVRCEVLDKKRKRLATHHVKEGGVEVPLCTECYTDWKEENEFFNKLKEDTYGNPT